MPERLDDGNVKALRGNVALRESSNAMKVTMDEQRKHVEEVGKGVGGRRREQEEHRGWLKLTV